MANNYVFISESLWKQVIAVYDLWFAVIDALDCTGTNESENWNGLSFCSSFCALYHLSDLKYTTISCNCKIGEGKLVTEFLMNEFEAG